MNHLKMHLKRKFNFKKKNHPCARGKTYTIKKHLGVKEKLERDEEIYDFFFFKYFSYSKFVSIYWRKLTIVYIIVSLQKGSWSRALDKSKSKRKQFPSLSFSFPPVSLSPSLFTSNFSFPMYFS